MQKEAVVTQSEVLSEQFKVLVTWYKWCCGKEGRCHVLVQTLCGM